jgi:hypothetical protein
MTQHCCEAMARQANWRCDRHDDPFDCPDAVVVFSARFQEYGLIVHGRGIDLSEDEVPAEFRDGRRLASPGGE